jgi:hypothetical protein
MRKAARKTKTARKRPHKSHARRKTAVRKTSARRASVRKSSGRKSSSRKSLTRRWSARVTKTSDAMTLDEGVFKKSDPKAIARSVKRSAEHSHRRKSPPFRSAMSMLTFYINRGGKNLSARKKHVLMQAKDELRALYHKE